MAEMLFQAHSGIRYLVLLAGIIALITAALDLRAPAPGRASELSGRAFNGVLDLQVLLGLVLLIVWPWTPRNIGHVVMMVLAAAVAHGAAVAARRRPTERRAGLRLAGIAGALLLIVGGILAIRDSIV